MSDPRIDYYAVPSERATAKEWADAFDKRDAAALVVRVDTRNPATIERIARQLLINDYPEHPNAYWQPPDWEPYEDAASAVLAALTEGA